MTGYNPTIWIDKETPVNAQNMNKVEGGIEQQNNDMFILSEYVVDLDNRVSNDIQTLSEYVVELNSDDIGYTTEADNSIKTIQDALDKLLYVPLTVNFSSNTSGVLEKGSAISNLTFNWSYNKNVKSQTINGEDLEPSLRTYQYSEVLNANKTFTLKANDGKSDFSKSLSYSFIYPIYIGSVSTDTPTESDIKAMTKKVVSPSNQSFTYTVDNKRMCICVPSNWTIRSIIDPNNFNITSSFKQTTINLQCLDTTQQSYKVYISEPTSQSNFVVKYNV